MELPPERASHLPLQTRQAVLARLRRIRAEVGLMITQVEARRAPPLSADATAIALLRRGAEAHRALGRLSEQVTFACAGTLASGRAPGDAAALRSLLGMVVRSRRFLCLFCRSRTGRAARAPGGRPQVAAVGKQ